MKHLLFPFLPMLFCITIACAQNDKHLRGNLAGTEAGFDLFHSSIAAGIGYERMIAQGNKTALGIKGKHFFRHKNDNIKRNHDDTRPIYASQSLLMLKGYLYLDQSEKPYGIFLYTGAGAMYTKREMKQDGTTLDLSGFSPGLDAGLGANLPLNKKTFMQLCLSLTTFFDSKKNDNSLFLNWSRTNALFMPGISASVGF